MARIKPKTRNAENGTRETVEKKGERGKMGNGDKKKKHNHAMSLHYSLQAAYR